MKQNPLISTHRSDPHITHTVASTPFNEKFQSVFTAGHSYWIAINCTRKTVSVIIGLCASVFFFKPRSTLPCLNSASLWPRAQWHAPGYSTVMCCCAEGLAVWFVYSPERAFQSLFQPSNSLCLSLPCSVSPSPSLSLSLSPFHPPPPFSLFLLG